MTMKTIVRNVNIATVKNATKGVPTEDVQLNDVKVTTKVILGDVVMTTMTMMTKKIKDLLDDRDERKVAVIQVKKMMILIDESRRGNVGIAEMKKRRRKNASESVGKTKNEKKKD